MNNSRILFVDDVADWRTMLSGFLSDYAFDVTAVESDLAARQILKTQSFDLAIIDLRLDETDESNTDGLNTAKYVKANYPSIPIIILTGYGTMEDVENARRIDPGTGIRLVEDFIEKDNIDELPEKIGAIFSRRK